MKRLRIIPLDDTVVFPGMTVTLPVDVGSDDRVLLVPRRDETYANVGVVADVAERVRLAGRGLAVSMTGLHRAVPGGADNDQDGVLRVDVEARPDHPPAPGVTRDLEREYRAVVDEILELRGDDGRIRAFVRSITDAGALADTAGYSPDLSFAQKLQLLETFDVADRLKLALQFQRDRLAELQVRKRIRDDVEGFEQVQLLVEGQVGRVAGRVGERSGVRNGSHERADPSVVTSQLEDLVDDGAVLALQLAGETGWRRLVRMGFVVDAEYAVLVFSRATERGAVEAHQ